MAVDRLLKLQARRLKEAREKQGFKSARAAQLHFGWTSAYPSHENAEEAFGLITTSDPERMRIVQSGFEKKDLLEAA